MKVFDLINELVRLEADYGRDKICVVVDTDIEPNLDVLNVYYDEELDRICLTLF